MSFTFIGGVWVAHNYMTPEIFHCVADFVGDSLQLAREAAVTDAKVIVLTNYAFPQYRAKSLALGADFFFDKSREYHRVREVLEGIADKRMSAEH